MNIDGNIILLVFLLVTNLVALGIGWGSLKSDLRHLSERVGRIDACIKEQNGTTDDLGQRVSNIEGRMKNE